MRRLKRRKREKGSGRRKGVVGEEKGMREQHGRVTALPGDSIAGSARRALKCNQHT